MERNPTVFTGRVQAATSPLATNKVLRNTYLLLSATLAFSAATAGAAWALELPILSPWLVLIGYFALLFAVHKTADSAWGLAWVFALTGFMGFTIGPILSLYVKAIPDGHTVVMSAFGITAAAFLALSAYAIRSGRRFTFMGGFLAVGIITAFLLGIVALAFSLPALSLVVSGLFVMLMAGLILFETGEIVHGGETNYIHATVTLYVSIYNLFMSLLHLLGAGASEE
jgi:modulator of FtsH protease